MNILIPWNLSYYRHLNIYNNFDFRLLENITNNRLLIPKHNLTEEQYIYLDSQGVYDGNIDDKVGWIEDLDKNLKEIFYTSISKRELNYASYLSGDIEFLHTAPITKGDRKFIIYIDDFILFFYPFINKRDMNSLSRLSELKNCYEKLLLNKCILILSHNKEVLSQFESFFNNKEITAKLNYIPLVMNADNKKKIHKSDNKTFLYIKQATNNINDFIYTGGMISLRVALLILKEENNFQFVFVTKKPSDDYLNKYNINIELLNKLESSGDIIWVETIIPKKMLLKLIEKSHFILSIGLKHQYNTLLEAMEVKTIPLTMDIDDNILNLPTETIINIKKHLLQETSTNNNIDYCSFELYMQQSKQITLELTQKIKIITENLDIYNKLSSYYYINSGVVKNYSIFSLIDKCNNNIESKNIIKSENNKNIKLYLGEMYIEDFYNNTQYVSSDLYDIFNVGFGKYKRRFDTYIFILTKYKNINILSHLDLVRNKYNEHFYKKLNIQVCNITEHLHRLVDSRIRLNTDSDDIVIAKNDCPYCSGDIKGLKKRVYFLKYKMKKILILFPTIFYLLKCGKQCIIKNIRERRR